MKITKKIAALSFLVATLSLLNACGTIQGFGKDVSSAGRDIQRAAR